jgi:hypothetical protein
MRRSAAIVNLLSAKVLGLEVCGTQNLISSARVGRRSNQNLRAKISRICHTSCHTKLDGL